MSNNKIDLNLLTVFVKVAELESFTQAAKSLNQPKSRVSRAISKLEAELGADLIRRTTRRISLTTSGNDFYQKIAPLLKSLQREITHVSNQAEEMSGILRITATQDLGQSLLPKVVAKFNAKYPEIEIQTLITNDILDLTKENIDISFRAGTLKDSSLIQKKIMSASFIAVCSKDYIEKNGEPLKISDLADHKFLSFRGFEKEFFGKKSNIKASVTSDSISTLLNLSLNNAGIAVVPDYFCKNEIKSKKLVRVLTDWKSKTGHIHMLYSPSQNTSIKIRKFIEIAAECV